MLVHRRIEQLWNNLSRWKWQLAVFAIIHVLIFTIFFKTGWIYGNLLQDDSGLDYFYATRIMLGNIPYHDFAVEYPPLALLFMLLPRLFASNTELYSQLFNIEMLAFDVLGLFLVAAIARLLDKTVWKTLTIYTLVLLAIGPIVVVRFDIIPAIILLSALYAFLRGNSTVSWVLLAVGTLTKLFPAVVMPILLIYHLKHHQYRQMIKGVSAFTLVCLIFVVPFMLLDPGGLLSSFTYHTGRSLQVESTYASFLLLARACGLTSLQIEFSSGSTNVVSPLANTLANWSTLITLLFLLVVFWAYYRSDFKLREDENTTVSMGRAETAGMVNYFLLAVTTSVLTGKVFSPQYLLWLMPLVPLITSRRDNLFWLILVMAGLMTYFVYPKDYGGLVYGELLAIGMLVLRNIALIVFACLVAWDRRLFSTESPLPLKLKPQQTPAQL